MSNFILSAFADEISSHLDEQIQVLLKNDIHYMEFRNLEGKVIIDYSIPEITAVSKTLTGEGIEVSALGSPIGKIMITDPFPPHLDRFKKTVETAQILGSPNIRMFSFFIPNGEKPEQFRGEVLARWNKFIEVSEDSGLILLHENEKDIYGDTADRCLDLLTTLSHPRVWATFDPANFVQCSEETYPRAFQMLQHKIYYMHIKDARKANGEVVPSGKGDGHLFEILGELNRSGYEGFLSIEPHLNKSLPGGGPGNFALAANALKDLLSKL